MQKVLVTGSSGFVGSRFVQRWKNHYHLLLPTHSEMDITDESSVLKYFQDHQPDVVLHLAALSNTWYCEQHPEESRRVNVEGTFRLAQAAVDCGAKFLFFSSDQIYNGNRESGLLSEEVSVSPENHYGRHKLEAEKLVASVASDAVSLRATWMYDADLPGKPVHKNFVTNFANAVKERQPLTFAVREYRGITWLREVIEFLPLTFQLPGGVYNYGAENIWNTYETACRYFLMMETGLPVSEMVLADEKRFEEHVRNISISNDKIRKASQGKICFSDTLFGLQKYWEAHSNS